MGISGPLISVIIPVYNVEFFLKKCVYSVLDQDYENIELILVNDGSTDSSYQICHEISLKDNRVKVINQNNQGASVARNVGITESSGDFLMFLDSDDYWVENCLGSIVDVLRKNKFEIDVVFLKNAVIKNDSGELSSFWGYEFNNLNREELADYIVKQKKVAVSACLKVLNRKLFDNTDMFFKEKLLAEDIDWFFNLLITATSFTTYNGDFYCYRKRSNSASQDLSDKRIKDYIYILNKWASKVNEVEAAGILKSQLYYMLGYEYEILLASFRNFDSNIREKYKNDLVNLFFLEQYRSEPRSRLIKFIYNIFGFDYLTIILNFYLNTRIKSKKTKE